MAFLNFKQGHSIRQKVQTYSAAPAAESMSCQVVTINDDCPQVIPTTCKDPSQTEDMPSDVHPVASLLSALEEFKKFLPILQNT